MKVSVLMPVYNAERFLAEAVDSIQYQTFRDFEFVIVDDCSTDASWRILQEYAVQDSRFRVLRNETNQGIAATRNRLMVEASPESEYFALMDADDVAFPERFEKQLEYLEAHPELAAVGSSIWIIDEESRRIGRRDYPSDPRRIAAAMIRYNPISQSSMMIHRSAVKTTGLYNLKYRAASDYDYWLRMQSHYSMGNLSEPLMLYRISTTQCKRKNLRRTILVTLELQRRYLFTRRFFSLPALISHLTKYLLLLLPAGLVFRLFLLFAYKPADSPRK